MRKTFRLLLLLTFLSNIFLLSFSQAENENVLIVSPSSGEAVQGLVKIIGTANPEDFQRYILNFYLQNSEILTPFEISRSNTPVKSGILGNWETSQLTDGDYILELIATLSDGSTLSHLVEGIRVRNYSAIETNTPESQIEVTEAIPTQFPTSKAEPSSTEVNDITIEKNPAEIDITGIKNSVFRGIIISVVGLILLLIYTLYKNRDN